MIKKMLKEKIGSISENDKDNALSINSRINSLEELLIALDEQDFSEDEKKSLHERINKDINETNNKLDNWWITMAKKYKWAVLKKTKLFLDIDTCNVFIFEDSSEEAKDNCSICCNN